MSAQTEIDAVIINAFERLDWAGYSNEEIIAAMHEMGYIDLADAYFNWCQEDGK